MEGTRWIRSFIGMGMLALVVAGCDEAERDAITAVEADAVARVITDATVGAWWGQAGASVTPNDGLQLMTKEEYDEIVECPEGGTMHLKGTIESSEDGSSTKIEGTITFDNCASKTEDGETVVLTEGTINDLLEVRIATDDGLSVRIDLDGSWDGSVSWENEDDGSSGVCDVDVTLDVTITLNLETGTWDAEGGITGTVCGQSVDDDDWTIEVHTEES